MRKRRYMSEAAVLRMMRRYPRCGVCGEPMVAGQSGSHLSCAEGPFDLRVGEVGR